ncbi:MAG: glycosyltransferase family 2 protein [Acidobacteriaceae bacterium]|nr:glycosyltransferase family 2 protein [Acidobacteriaceae bacterium]
MSTPAFDVSIILVSFNTESLTRECLQAVLEETKGLTAEIFVVDNASRDDSASMIEREFPQVRLFRSNVNLGFGNANNVALKEATGRYIVLLNTDAFLAPGGLRLAMERMDATPRCGMGGARLIGRDGGWQPSARTFHGLWVDATVLTGLSTRYPHSRLFGGLDRTWADQNVAAAVDWVPGAFAILRPKALAQVGAFDPAFFLYYEEVDLCYRLKQARWEIWYWPEIVVTHIGGESSRSLKTLEFSSAAAQVVLWRMRSTLLYYRKHHGEKARLAKWMEQLLYTASAWRNDLSSTPERKARAHHFKTLSRLFDQAWDETKGGRISPPAPW